jgi:hypothetical protein
MNGMKKEISSLEVLNRREWQLFFIWSSNSQMMKFIATVRNGICGRYWVSFYLLHEPDIYIYIYICQ